MVRDRPRHRHVSRDLEAALRGRRRSLLAVDAVMAGEVRNAFVAMRPPGHHAERRRPMGFCFFNHAAIAARHAQAVHGAERVAMVDFDVHHGNGSRTSSGTTPTVLYCSTHQMPLFPGTGLASERGEHDTIVNVPLRTGDGGEVFREAIESRILPRLEAFGPDLMIISAGFDAHRRDPLANLRLKRPTSPGRRASSWRSRDAARGGSCRSWRAATTWRASPHRSPRMSRP